MEEPDTDVKKDWILNLLDDVLRDLREYEIKNVNTRISHGAWYTLREKVRNIEKEVEDY